MPFDIKSLLTGGIKGIEEGFSSVVSKFKADPTKVAEFEAEFEQAKLAASLKIQELANQAEEIQAKELETVNATMREEAKSEHWAVWLWRPLIGFTFSAMVINNFILIPYFKKYGVESISIPSEISNAMLVILGVASAGRSVTKWQHSKNQQHKPK